MTPTLKQKGSIQLLPQKGNKKKHIEKEKENMEENQIRNLIEIIELMVVLKRKDNQMAVNKIKEKENNKLVQNTFKYLTSAGKRSFKTAYKLGMHEHPKGTTLRLLINTKINHSENSYTTYGEKTKVKTKIKKLAIKNSSQSSQMRNEKKGIRYRNKCITVLYDYIKQGN